MSAMVYELRIQVEDDSAEPAIDIYYFSTHTTALESIYITYSKVKKPLVFQQLAVGHWIILLDGKNIGELKSTSAPVVHKQPIHL